MPRPLLTVVIPTRNRRHLVLENLRALAAQSLPPDQFEVVVVVDGSTDGTVEALRESTFPFALRQCWREGRGRAAACNAGIREAQGELILLLDDDMVGSPALLSSHADVHRSADRVGAVGPVPIELAQDAPPVARYIGRKFNRHLEALANGASIGFHDLYTGNFSIRRELIESVGLFDEDFTVYGNEDGELAVRLLAAGVRLVYAPGAIATQRYTKTFTQLAMDNEAKGRTSVVLARKHPQAIASLRLGARPSRRLRLGRTALLGLTRAWGGVPTLTLAAAERLGRRAPRTAMRLYPALLDYFYWLGASAEIRRSGPLPAASRADRFEQG